MKRKPFCQLCPTAYKISTFKCRTIRHFKNLFVRNFATTIQQEPLKYVICKHNSLIRRKLGNVDMKLQENNATNLNISAPKVTNIIIKPNEIFSFWKLVGKCSEKNGYKQGLVISNGATSHDFGGGMCQFTNLIHWIILHSPMEIIEHHHHNNFDLFPDFNRQIPFGVGTSILYNYIDYRFKNTTDTTFQLVVYTTDEYLCGELRADNRLPVKYHIVVENEYFTKEGTDYYRNNRIYRNCVDKKTGNVIENKLIMRNHSKIMYDPSYIKSEIIDMNKQEKEYCYEGTN